MKKVIIEAHDETEINLSNIPIHIPIFAKIAGKLKGMLVKENGRWIVKLGAESGATGYYDSRTECLISCLQYHYDFYIA